MLKSVRFWMAVLLVLSAVGYTRFREQYLLNVQPSKQPAKAETASSAIQTEPHFTDASAVNTTESQKVTEALSSSETDETALIPTECTESSEIFEDMVEDNASVPFLSEQKLHEITERFQLLTSCSEDLIGWIYLADSEIDYPVVQGSDNQYYLHHAPDKTKNQLGTIFLDAHCSSDFSDKQNILFGHNMQYGMFGDIRSLKEKECFEHYRYGWLFTKDYLYRIDFYALVIVSAYDTIYDIPADVTEWQNSVKEHSLYYTETEISEDDCILALSTCASDFENARALFIGKLKPATVKEGESYDDCYDS